MTTLKVIKNRIRTVGNTKKISQTMRMVSAAKYAKTEKELKGVRPFGNAALQFYELTEINPPNDPESQLMIALTGDRGLCGSIHSGIAKTISTDLERIPKLSAKTKLICIGDKTRLILSRDYSKKILWVASEIGKKPMTFLDAAFIAQKILKTQTDDEFHQTLIYYNKLVKLCIKKFIIHVNITRIRVRPLLFLLLKKSPKIKIFLLFLPFFLINVNYSRFYF